MILEMQNVIISDSSCLILLKNIEKLNILEKLYGQILVTPEIANEVKERLSRLDNDKKSCKSKISNNN